MLGQELCKDTGPFTVFMRWSLLESTPHRPHPSIHPSDYTLRVANKQPSSNEIRYLSRRRLSWRCPVGYVYIRFFACSMVWDVAT